VRLQLIGVLPQCVQCQSWPDQVQFPAGDYHQSMTCDPGGVPKTKRLQAKPISKLSRRELAECEQLSFQDHGEMSYHLHDVAAGNRDGITLFIQDDAGYIIAWALLCDLHDRKLASAVPEAQSSQQRAFFYVAPEHRRRGLGKRLMAAVLRRDDHARVKSWDAASEAFFDRYPELDHIGL